MAALEWKDHAIKGRFYANGIEHRYRVHPAPDNENLWWWRYGRNIGQYGSELSCGLAKLAAQNHHNEILDVSED